MQSPMYLAKINSPQTILSALISSTDLVIALEDTTVLPSPPNLLVIGFDTNNPETCLYTNINNNLVTLQRGVEGNSQSFPQGTKVARLFTAYDYNVLVNNIVDLNTQTSELEPALPSTPLSPDNKYLNGNRQWSEITVGSGGYAANVYPTNMVSTINSGYKQASYINDLSTTEKTIVVNNNEVISETYLFESQDGITTIDAGIWIMNFYAKTNNMSGNTLLKLEAFSRTITGVETVLFSKYTDSILNTDYKIIRIEINQPSYVVNSTDRIGVRIYGKTDIASNVTISYVIGDGNASYFNTPLALRHMQLRGLNDDINNIHIALTDKTAITHSNRTALDLISGTNTGDETVTTIKSKLGITTLSGSNTGDQDLTKYATKSFTVAMSIALG